MDNTPTVSDIEGWLEAEFFNLGFQPNGVDTHFF